MSLSKNIKVEKTDIKITWKVVSLVGPCKSALRLIKFRPKFSHFLLLAVHCNKVTIFLVPVRARGNDFDCYLFSFLEVGSRRAQLLCNCPNMNQKC